MIVQAKGNRHQGIPKITSLSELRPTRFTPHSLSCQEDICKERGLSITTSPLSLPDYILWIMPQAIFFPAFPDGCVLKSFGPSKRMFRFLAVSHQKEHSLLCYSTITNNYEHHRCVLDKMARCRDFKLRFH